MTTGTAASAASIFSRLLNASAFMLRALLSQLKLWSTCDVRFPFILSTVPFFFKEIGLVRGFCELSCKDDNVIRCPFSVYFSTVPLF